MISDYRAPWRRINHGTRQRVERVIGQLHIGHITRPEAEHLLTHMLLNADTVARIVNRVPGTIDWRTP